MYRNNSQLLTFSSILAAIVSVIMLILTVYHDLTVKKLLKELKNRDMY
jgi:hypothetical protein